MPYIGVAALALIVVQAGIAAVFYLAGDGASATRFNSELHLIGTLVMLSVMPTYLLAGLLYMFRASVDCLDALAMAAPREQVARVRDRLGHLPVFCLATIPAGAAFGLSQNLSAARAVLGGQGYSALDLGVIVGNCIVWSVVATLISWRLPVSWALKSLGQHLAVDLYRVDRLRPLPNLAAKDVLVVAGALALMPLQALDAQFRWANYQAGLQVGVPAALALFLLPVWGLRSTIRDARLTRIGELMGQLETVDRGSLVELEALSAHIERLQKMPNLPIDTNLILKLLGYAIIAPLAWVGAALVEGLVEGLGL